MNQESQIYQINILDIIPNRFQPRLTFDEQALQELAASIKEHGIIQPLVLRRLGDKYEIIAGERRYKASQLAGLERVPAIVVNMDDNKSAEVAIVENLQRKNLSAIEEAKSYKKLLDRGYLTQEELAKKMGISQSSIANKIRLLNLTDEVQNALAEEKISERHARSLLQITDNAKQIELLNRVVTERLTVRQLEEEIRKIIVKKEVVLTPPEPAFIPVEEEVVATPIQEDEELKDLARQIEALNNSIGLSSPYETFNIPTAEELNKPIETVEESPVEEFQPKPPEEVVEAKSTVEKGNITSAVNAVRNATKNIEEADFKIETEEFDFEDLYQIIIKIEK